MINTFKSLNPKSDYRLTKIYMKRPSMVYPGDRVTGTLTILEVPDGKSEDFMVFVDSNRLSGGLTYIRTTPIQTVISTSPQSIVFETEGGIYLLEILPKESTT